MQILIPSTTSTDTIFLVFLSPCGYIFLTSFKITSTQDRLYVPSVTSSMNSLSSSSFLDMDRVQFFRHRSCTWTETYSFEQDTSQTWCHRETSAVKTGTTNVWDNAILTPTESGDDVGTRFFNTDCGSDVAGSHFCASVPTSSHFSPEFPENTWLSTSVIHTKTILKGLILIILSTYQGW